MNLLDTFSSAKEIFCNLWKYKLRGETLEIITPFTTPNQKFVSVFVTQKNEAFVITDGGWLHAGEYSSENEIDSKSFEAILLYYEAFYELKRTTHFENVMFYKTASDIEMIPNRIHDIAQFVSQILSTYGSMNQDKSIDIKEAENFSSNVDNYITGIVPRSQIKFRVALSKEYDGVRFSAIITRGTKLSLVKYVTGATFDYYRKVISNATVDFEIASESDFRPYIKNKIAVLNDTANGFEAKKIYPYISRLEDIMERPVVRWSQRDNLSKIL
jgi:hypothetical protein